MRKKTAIILTLLSFVSLQCGAGADAFGQDLKLKKSGVEDKQSQLSPEMQKLLPVILQQLQNNPELLSKFGLGGIGALGGLNGMGALGEASGHSAGVGGLSGTGQGMANIPGLDKIIAEALAKQQGAKAGTPQKAGSHTGVPAGIPEQVKIYRELYHPVDMNQDGKISADEGAAYASWMFRRRDINGDGVLVMREFSAVERLPGDPDANKTRLRNESNRFARDFAKYDKNGDKIITKQEFLEQVKADFYAKCPATPVSKTGMKISNQDDQEGAGAPAPKSSKEIASRVMCKDIDPFDFDTVLPF